MSENILEIRPVVKNKVRNYTYIYTYHNVWKDGRSHPTNKRIVGVLGKDNTVEFGKTFLTKHPELRGLTGKYETGVVKVLLPQPSLPAVKEIDSFMAELFSKAKIEQSGASYLLFEIAKKSGINQDLEEVFGRERAKEILSLAICFTLFENDAAAAYEDRAQTNWFPAGVMTSQRISELFEEIISEQTSEYLHRRVLATQKEGVSYWAYDTTSISSYSELISRVAYGHSKEDPSLPQLNLALITDGFTNEPVYYQVLEGTISDAKAFRNMLADMAFIKPEDIRLVIDRAFTSPSLLDRLYSTGIGFVGGAKNNYAVCSSSLSWAEPILLKMEADNYDVGLDIYSVTRKITWHFNDARTGIAEKKDLYVHVYFSPESRDDQIRHVNIALKTLGQKKPDKLTPKQQKYLAQVSQRSGDKYVVDKKKKNEFFRKAGFFFLLSDSVGNSKDALTLYRERDVIEKAYTNYKERCGGRRLRCADRALNGKVFVLFIALALRLILGKQFRDIPEQDRRVRSVEELLRKAQTVNRVIREANGKKIVYWQAFPKSVAETLFAMNMKIPHSY